MSRSETALAYQTPLQEHYETLRQQNEAANYGMWVFIAQEILFFGALLTAYLMYRSAYPMVFAEASRHTEVVSGTLMTELLIGTSLSMTLAIREAQLFNRWRTIYFLWVTVLLGIGFLFVEGTEYFHMWEEHLVPGAGFSWEGPERQRAQMFFYCFFTATGLHALHVMIGVSILAVLAILAGRGRMRNYTVEIAGMYWHFVDSVWMFLYPLFYLVDRHK